MVSPIFFFGGGGHCKGGKLKADMTELDGPLSDMNGLIDFHEGTWVFKRNGIYYLTYADNYGHPQTNRMQYAISSSPLGPWTSKGVYLEPTDCDTTHGSVVEYKGLWYQFYHNKSLSGRGNLRSICVDKVNFNEDGTIQTVVQTKTGVPSVGRVPSPNPKMVKYEAESASVGDGATVENDSTASGGKNVQNFQLPGSYLQFNHVDGGEKGSRVTIDICYAATDKGKLRLNVNAADYSFVNTFSTGGLNNYEGHSYLTVALAPGKANVIKVVGGNGRASVDYITINPLP